MYKFLIIMCLYVTCVFQPVYASNLTYLEVHKNGANGVDGLDGAIGVSLSPDGKHVYVTGELDDSIAVFTRNTTTGKLSYIEVHKDGINGVDGLDFAYDVTVSPDGKNVYVVGSNDHAIAVFSRDSTTGKLTFIETQKDGVNGVDGIFVATDVAVTPDGKHVYAIGSQDNAVAVFNRNATTGQLNYLEMHKDSLNGVDGLDGAVNAILSTDGKQVYITGFGDNAVAVFNRAISVEVVENIPTLSQWSIIFLIILLSVTVYFKGIKQA